MLAVQDTLLLRFARHGTLLLLAGLLTGFGIGQFPSHHLGNAAHLTGLIGGFGLIAVGWLWPRLRLGARWSQFGAWIFIISMHLSWLGLALKGALGSGPDAPLNSVGQSAGSWDAVSGYILLVAALLSVAATLIMLVGLRPELQGRGSQK
jgi:hypothetical protein